MPQARSPIAGKDYVYYEYDRIYDKATKKTNPKRGVGKQKHF